MVNTDHPTPPEQNMSPTKPQKKKKLKTLILTVIGGVFAILLYWASPLLLGNGPVQYGTIVDHFKYGSIGSESVNGIPYWIWKVMPVMFGDKLPSNDHLDGYEALGFLTEPDHERPIGFSQRKTLIPRVGLNCALCHAGLVQESSDVDPKIIPTMPSNTVDLEGYIRFISAAAVDERFTPAEMLPEMEALGADFNPLEKLVYRFIAIPQTRNALIRQGDRLSFLERQPDWGPGRVDTFNPYKALQFNFPMDQIDDEEIVGTADLPVIWSQNPRSGLQLHWDGNNDSVDERNLSAALGAGVTPATTDFAGIKRVADWLWDLKPPAFPYPVDSELAAQGETVYRNNCASCHAFGGEYTGTVEPIKQIGTDPHRLNSYTYELLSNQNMLYAATENRFKHFRKTDGYANLPLDGVWLRSPYLHNGSVPTMTDLLNPPQDRPQTFYRGNPLYDPDHLGFVADAPTSKTGDEYFKFDTTLSGNDNVGHLYGTDLPNNDKQALIEYLKTL